MTEIVGHLLVFTIVAIGALIVPLLIGKLVRPKLPTPEKDAIYECGEPTIGSSYVQFDLRFYTVALLFIIFDVEVAFFFPWATIYGGATQMADSRLDYAPGVVVDDLEANAETASLRFGWAGRVTKIVTADDESGESVKDSKKEAEPIREFLVEFDRGPPNLAGRTLTFDTGEAAKSGPIRVAAFDAETGKVTLASQPELKAPPEAGELFFIRSPTQPSFVRNNQLVATGAGTLGTIVEAEANARGGFDVRLAAPLESGVPARTAVLAIDPARIAIAEKMLSAKPGTMNPENALSPSSALGLAVIGLCDILVFFGVLLVGFAYVWKRGDLDWVRALVQRAQQAPARPRTPTTLEQHPDQPQPVA